MVQPTTRPRMPGDPPVTPPATPPATRPAQAIARPGQLLRYEPSGLLGGTFTCTRCGAQAWQPDLLAHACGCPYRPAPLAAERAG